MNVRWSVLLVVGLVAGCNKGGGDAATAAPEVAKESAPAKTGAAKPTLAGHSAVPTVAEWSGVGEVTVKGSSALGCETKQVREWIRISCRGKNSTGGKPTGVTVDRGDKNRGDVFKFVKDGIVSLVFPFADGTDFAATFTWTDGSRQLVASWPHGSPTPAAVGEFR